MTAQIYTGLMKKLGLLVGAAGVSVLLSMPAQAKSCDQERNQMSQERTSEAIATENTSPSSGEAKDTNQAGNIVEVAAGNGSFKILAAALEAAGLTDTLSGEGPFTVFAPTDEAFAALPSGTVERLLKPENKQELIELLKYHVVAGSVQSSDLSSGEVATVEGRPIIVNVTSEAVKVNNAQVVQADIPASNGVIHVIDQVIMPPNV